MDYMNYEERLEVAKKLYELSNAEQKTALECIFPELRESEDERIRKELIEYVKDQQSSFISAPDCRDKYEEEENNKYKSWIAWLEKQGGQKSTEWDEYDEMYVNALVAIVRKRVATDERLRDELIGWLSCLKCRLGE